MSRLPALRGKTHFRFSNPLTGQVYDNTKYQYSCFFEKEEENQQHQLMSSKSKSVINCSQKKNTRSIEKYSLNPQTNSVSLLSKPKIQIMENRWLNPVKRCAKHCRKTSQTFNLQKTYSLEGSITKEKNLNTNKIMKFSQIEVKVLQSNQKDNDFLMGQYSQKQFLIHLSRYFQMFFRNKLQGPLFQELCIFVQKKIDQIINSEDKGYMKQSCQQSYIIKSKISLYQKLLELEKIGNKELLKQMLLHYCVPTYQTRQIFLNDVISIISHKLQQRFHFDKNEKYVLLNEKGKVIKDFAQIKFSTKKLFVAVESQLGAILQKHFNHTKYEKGIKQKFSFKQTLKHHFRNEVTKGLYEQNPNSNMSFRKQMSEKRLNLDKAERIINLKNQKHCQARKRIKRLIQISKNKNHINNNNPSREIKGDAKEVIKFDKKILSTNERIMAEFKRFKRLNDYENAEFKNDDNNRNKVEFGIIAKESPYFNNKSQSQVQRIFSSLPFVSPNNSNAYTKQTITDQEYLHLRKLIACLAQREGIISFVDRYLCFDEYGQLQKQQLKQTLLFVIGERKTSEVILLTIWSWLQKNGVIINEAVSRGNMQTMYEHNKIVYYFIISLIFGTNETTALDLAEDII